MGTQTELLKGTLDLLILRTLALEPRHGIGISERIEQVTRGTFNVKPGSLFPALQRLEQNGHIQGAWTTSAEGRRVKSYQLTGAGKRRLSVERRQWSRIVAAIAQVLEAS
jgi:PadR family transcriptional regulator PadR